jgi:hypothetical protein
MDQTKILYYLTEEQSDALFSEAVSIQQWERIWLPTDVLPGCRYTVDLNDELMRETKSLVESLVENRTDVVVYWVRLLPKEYIPLEGRWGKSNSHLNKIFHVLVKLPENFILKFDWKMIISELDEYRDSILDVNTRFVNYHYINQSDSPFYLLMIEKL